MPPSNSSTSSSDANGGTLGDLLRVACWALLWLVAFDVIGNRLTRPPSDPTVHMSTLQLYFQYGRSIEGKLRRQITPDDAHTEPVSKIGWIAATSDQRTRPDPGKILIAAYGQSFLARVLMPATEMDPRLQLRLFGGPGAPMSHSYKLYQDDRTKHQASIVVISVLASTLPMLSTMTTMTWAFENVTPYTYPRYRVVDGKLTEHAPSVTSLQQLRDALADRTRFDAFRSELQANDDAFDSVVFDADVFDYSLIGRCVRRAMGQRNQHRFNEHAYGPAGFSAELIDTADAMLAEFAASAKSDGRIPFVMLFNDRGYREDLYRQLGPRLRARGIAFSSSQDIAPPSDASVFESDGHFRHELEQKMSRAWLQQMSSTFDALAK